MLDLTGTNPTRAGLAWPPEALLGSPGDVGIARYEPDPRGPAATRESVAAYLTSRVEGGGGRENAGQEPVDPARIFLTASTSEAYAHLFRLLCDPGDEVLVPRPAYPLIEPIARVECVRVVPYRLVYDSGWRLDVDSLEASAGPRTRAVVLVQPNNPTGSCLNAGEIGRVESLCLERGIAIVSDEVFGDFPWAPDLKSLPSLHGATPAATFTLGGASKACGLPQLKVGWIAASGPEEALARLLPGLEWLRSRPRCARGSHETWRRFGKRRPGPEGASNSIGATGDGRRSSASKSRRGAIRRPDSAETSRNGRSPSTTSTSIRGTSTTSRGTISGS